jgi:hypothetical protein
MHGYGNFLRSEDIYCTKNEKKIGIERWRKRCIGKDKCVLGKEKGALGCYKVKYIGTKIKSYKIKNFRMEWLYYI